MSSHSSLHETGPEGVDLIRWPHRNHTLPEAEVTVFFTSRDITPSRWVNTSNTVHAPHVHTYKKILFCISGEITFSFPDFDQEYTLNPGDRLIIPAGLRHSAVAGLKGVTCIEGQSP